MKDFAIPASRNTATVAPVDEVLPITQMILYGLQHVLVMYAGRTMEYGQARDVFYQPSHPYSIGLLNAVPRLDGEGDSLLTIPGNPPNLRKASKDL